MSAGLSDLNRVWRGDVVDDDDSEPIDRNSGRDVGRVVAQTLVKDGIPLEQRRRLDRGEAACIVLAVPGVDWVKPIADAVQGLWPNTALVSRDGSSRTEHTPGRGNFEAGYLLAKGTAVAGVSHAPSRHLPSALVSLADATVTIVAPTSRQLRRILRLCANRPVPRTLPEAPASGLSFSEIVGAIRAGQTAGQALAIMARARASKAVVVPNDDTPPLERLVGLGKAKDWGLDLATGLAAWKRGDKSWSAMSTSAVIYGPPGVGKSMMARAIAKSCGVALTSTSVGAWFATSGGHLDDVIKAAQSAFDQARAQSPSLLFVDELDSVPLREKISRRGRDWWTPVVNFLLTLLDSGVTPREGIILLGATNYVDRLDSALVRPGRFDRLIEITLPTSEDIALILRSNLGAELPTADLSMVAKLGGRATGAIAAGWVRQARAVAQAAGRSLTLDDLIAAVAPKESRSPADVWRIAIHEAGHVVAGLHFGHIVGDVSIVPSMTNEGWANVALPGACPTASDIESVVIRLLAGRAAEIEVLGAPSAGAENDLARATSLVAASSMSFGFGGDLVHLASPESAAKALRRDLVLRKEVSQRLAALQDEANAVVQGNRDTVEAIARELATRRALAGTEVRQIARAGRL